MIYVFCTNFEREIVFVLIRRTGRTISGTQLVQMCRSTKNHDKILIKIKERMELTNINLL